MVRASKVRVMVSGAMVRVRVGLVQLWFRIVGW